ncbi:alpha,alpha-trehalase [Dyadobacter sp. CY351]|uniref:alpha,alpha-trehalase n=1 Tax=Dyadobacter sp. CY351 TaxID=2909337 RepID=UPI001F3F5422|nr:alpha,alpha-trehalase [Dyadobacter sp. CY351]MCF2517759.1 alpha,alpha-trehalase [Dyadobacter sp. CY351]
MCENGPFAVRLRISDTNLTAGGGEYANEEGFGWTNAVYLRLVESKNQIWYFFENAVC